MNMMIHDARNRTHDVMCISTSCISHIMYIVHYKYILLQIIETSLYHTDIALMLAVYISLSGIYN